MIKCVYPTQAAKLGVIAATYRAGPEHIFGTCPSSCPLLPQPDKGTTKIDWTYREAELKAIPRNGQAWSYTHFSWNHLIPREYGSVLNISTDTIDDAITTYTLKHPVTYTSPYTDLQWPRKIHGIPFVRCPAETNKSITCQTCGGGNPLCARRNRSFVVVFVAHGSSKQQINDKTQGGCYAAQGNCLMQWKATQQGKGLLVWNEAKDPERLVCWAKSLPKGTLLRHRISGDIGL